MTNRHLDKFKTLTNCMLLFVFSRWLTYACARSTSCSTEGKSHDKEGLKIHGCTRNELTALHFFNKSVRQILGLACFFRKYWLYTCGQCLPDDSWHSASKPLQSRRASLKNSTGKDLPVVAVILDILGSNTHSRLRSEMRSSFAAVVLGKTVLCFRHSERRSLNKAASIVLPSSTAG